MLWLPEKSGICEARMKVWNCSKLEKVDICFEKSFKKVDYISGKSFEKVCGISQKSFEKVENPNCAVRLIGRRGQP